MTSRRSKSLSNSRRRFRRRNLDLNSFHKRGLTANHDGYYPQQVFNAKDKCWKGFHVARKAGDVQNVVYYAAGIHKFQKQIGEPLYDFWEANMIGGLHREDYARYVGSEVYGVKEQLDIAEGEGEDAYTDEELNEA